MTNSSGLSYYSPDLADVDARKVDVIFEMTGVATAVPIPDAGGTLGFFGPLTTQSEIDDFLGTTDEFDVADFNATSMGADAYGVLINMGGQADQVFGFKATLDFGGTAVVQALGMPLPAIDGTVLNNQVALGSEGNIALITIMAGLETAGTGLLTLEVYWKAK